MAGETDLNQLTKGMNPLLNHGDYVFTTVKSADHISRQDIICELKEAEGTTLVLAKEKADNLKLNYDYIAAWITLQVHSSLDAVGLTALFSGELAKHKISCNVIAGYYHDHIFVNTKDAEKSINILRKLSSKYKKPTWDLGNG